MLARAYERALAAGGELLMVIPASAFVLSVFALTGLDRLIPNFADLHEALEEAQAVVSRPRATPGHAVPRRWLTGRLNPSGSHRGRYQRDRQPSARQYTTVCPAGPPASSAAEQEQFGRGRYHTERPWM